MTLRRLALPLCLLLALTVTGCARETPAEHAASTYAAQEMAAAPPHGNLPDYALPPAKLLQAQRLSSLGVTLHVTSELWRILQLLLLLLLGGIAWMRNTALRSTRSRWLQAYLFLFLLFATRTLLNLPLSLYGHHLSLLYGFSIQSWPSWFGDLAKAFALDWALGGLLLMLLFALIRYSPLRWWLLLALAGIPLTLAGAILYPIVVDPLFYQFEPLAVHHPDLVADLQRMNIPANRTFLMKASAKLTTPNAYVIGLGPTKRLVVWDTELDPSTQNPSAPSGSSAELLWTLGHESGHYVLNHVLEGILLSLALLPLLTWLAFLTLNWTLRRFGPAWRIPSTADWGAAAVLLLLISLGTTLAEPIANTVSRHVEHAADVYGQEAIHNFVPNPQAAVQSAADSMGLSILDDPNPNPLVEFWLYIHPATGRRAAFGHAYNPWAPSMEPKYFKK
jgi:STE24 endopeptidase